MWVTHQQQWQLVAVACLVPVSTESDRVAVAVADSCSWEQQGAASSVCAGLLVRHQAEQQQQQQQQC
jgi:hypothetical protein